MDSIMAETERLAYFTVVHALDLNSLHRSSNSNSGDVKTEQRLQACVLKMLERHSIVFSGMMQRLHISRSVNFRDSFSEISEELFKDEVSWSKIVALFALGARLGQHCRDNHMEDLVEDVAISLAAYAKERITPFIQQEGGWSSLCEVFPEQEDYESKVWRGLVLVGLGLTVATLIMFIRR